MRVVGRFKIDKFRKKHPDVCSHLDSWFYEVKSANWQNPHEIKNKYPKVSILSGNRVIFDLRGGSYRLEVRVDYTGQVVVINRIGTHKEYSRWR